MGNVLEKISKSASVLRIRYPTLKAGTNWESILHPVFRHCKVEAEEVTVSESVRATILHNHHQGSLEENTGHAADCSPALVKCTSIPTCHIRELELLSSWVG